MRREQRVPSALVLQVIQERREPLAPLDPQVTQARRVFLANMRESVLLVIQALPVQQGTQVRRVFLELRQAQVQQALQAIQVQQALSVQAPQVRKVRKVILAALVHTVHRVRKALEDKPQL